MRKFAFKLEALHEYRQKLEGMTLHDLAEVVQRLDEEELRLGVLKGLYFKAANEADAAKAASNISGLRHYVDYIDGLKRHIEAQDKVIDVFRAEYNAKKDALNSAFKDRKVIDNVKEKGLNRHIKTYDEAEQKEQDDINAAKPIKKW